ncbi:acyl-CoA thioesterase [Mucilaginibacter sp. OK098]|uniref:acyl-CoA thioesterase n=1 Tax=Mucilaginibacter sp. OK098 TaxID=1855297 RepID=UPI00091D7329|nr:acyl-CoA thioesterase [Mucilaginibacter sp. OK098]SHL90860.1 acyl-CoA thioester hydrolase [Mucilaginibacter sp. OK098]
MQKILQSTVKVRFQDCDPFNHLYNTRYLDYFLNAREDQLLEAYNLDAFGGTADTGLVWVISSNQICYLKSVFRGEVIIIDSQLIEVKPRSLTVEMRMWDENKVSLKSMLWTKFTYFNIKTQKPALHSDELTSLFNEIIAPVGQTNFDDRKTALIQELRLLNSMA